MADRWAGRDEWHQMLLRALMYRIATNEGCHREGMRVREHTANYQFVVDLVLHVRSKGRAPVVREVRRCDCHRVPTE